MPTILPTMAPMHREGMKRPAGTLMPNVNTVMTSLKINARASFHRAFRTPSPASASVLSLMLVKLRL